MVLLFHISKDHYSSQEVLRWPFHCITLLGNSTAVLTPFSQTLFLEYWTGNGFEIHSTLSYESVHVQYMKVHTTTFQRATAGVVNS